MPSNAKAISTKTQSLLKQLLKSQIEPLKKINGVKPPQKKAAIKYPALMNEFNQVRGRNLFYNYVGSGRGNGSYVELLDGSVKIDFINGIGVHIFGHSHPLIMKASLEGSLSDILMQGHLQMNQEYLNISKKAVSMAKGSRLKHAWICPSGSMANENSLKIARQKNSPARMILAMKDSFAGRTTMMAEVTDNPKYKEGLPTYNEVLRIPFYDKKDPHSTAKSLEILKKHIAEHPKDISSFYFEPMLGEGGYKVAPREYFIPLFEECRKHGIAIWADEVQTFLRTGQPYAFQTLGFADYIDICAIAKTAQCGMTLFTEEYNPKPGLIAGTFASSTPALASGFAILEEMEKKKYFGSKGKIAAIHKEFMTELKNLCKGSCKGLLEDPEGLGLMIAVTPFPNQNEKISRLIMVMFEKGLIAFTCGKGPIRLRFLLPAIVSKKEIKSAIKILEESILEVHNS